MPHASIFYRPRAHMSKSLRIELGQARRPSVQARTSPILRSSLPPESVNLRSIRCEILEDNGDYCRRIPYPTDEAWCEVHAHEMKNLRASWGRVLGEADWVEVSDPETAQQKVAKLEEALYIRRQIHERFAARSDDTSDFIKWIIEIENDVRVIADGILMTSFDRGPKISRASTPSRPGFEEITILRSPLTPRFATDSLQGVMPDDGTIIILKQFFSNLHEEGVSRLYGLCPDLDDSPRRAGVMFQRPPEDIGTTIVRTWFRLMVLKDSKAEALERAARSRTINDFLSGCHASQLETYCDFFQKAWRPHSLGYLRVAIAAAILDESEMRTIGLMGGIVPSGVDGFTMTKQCWDLMYQFFPTLLTPWTLGNICASSEDHRTVSKLLTQGAYREHWYDPKAYLQSARRALSLSAEPSQSSR